MIKLSEKQWQMLHNRLEKDYHDEPSVLIIRDKMKRVLGCVVRKHTEFIEERAPTSDRSWVWPKVWIFLDFYDDAKETFFRLKYTEYL